MTRIFVYGTLKRGCCRAHVLRGQRYLGEAATAPRYRLYDTGTYPALVEDPEGVSVRGELWEVDEIRLRVLDAIEDVPWLYERREVEIAEPPAADVQAYVYRRDVTGMADCGQSWREMAPALRDGANPDQEPLCVVEALTSSFAARRLTVDIVCAGDSLTGWNNFGPRRSWPFPTYPSFLQLLCSPRRLQVADGGIAGEVSDNGLRHVARYLQLFPSATYFVIGFGTNDLGGCTDGARASARIVDNVSGMVRLVREQGRTPLLLNIPDIKESAFPRTVAAETRALRDHHNRQLQAFCAAQHLALIDIRTRLRDEHFGDALHPNAHGASLIAEEVFTALDAAIRDSRVSSR